MILTQIEPGHLVLTDMSPAQQNEARLFASRYGERDLFVKGNPVLRPDGFLFIQGDLSTYNRTVLEPDPQFVSWSGIRFAGVSISERTGRPSEGVPNTANRTARHTILGYVGGRPGAQDPAIPHTLIPSLTTYRPLWVEYTYDVPGGQVSIRRLRATKEGRGM